MSFQVYKLDQPPDLDDDDDDDDFFPVIRSLTTCFMT